MANSTTPKIRNNIHNDSILRKASDYLEYDIHTLAAGFEIYLMNKGTEIGNAAMDSVLLRSRILMDFFFREGEAPKDDVIAIDYFHDMNPKPYKIRKTQKLWKEREKINKRLMHLTTEPMPRLRSNQVFYLSKIIPPILQAFYNWLEFVPDNRIQKPSKKSKGIFKTHLERLAKYF